MKIYIYETPQSKEQGCLKIGETGETNIDRHNDVNKRISEQFKSAAIFDEENTKYTILFDKELRFKDTNELIHDTYIHKVLEYHKVVRKIVNYKKTEWFEISLEKLLVIIGHIVNRTENEIDINRFLDFKMRPEQITAVNQTYNYFFNSLNASSKNTIEFLWNAKMRFGKTFTAYQLALKMNLKRILILTYKPAVQDAWQNDLNQHKDFKNYHFLTRDNLKKINNFEYTVAFASYQDLLGKTKDNQTKDKHLELFKTDWDLVIIDEFHFGAGTSAAEALSKIETKVDEESNETKKEFNTDEKKEIKEVKDAIEEEFKILEKQKLIKTKYRLFLSGTPFKAIQNEKFDKDQIFNWTYVDEQREKLNWDDKNGENPYLELPTIELYLYQMSKENIKSAIELSKDEFDLNTFFNANPKCENKRKKGQQGKIPNAYFMKKNKENNNDEINKWLDLISNNTNNFLTIKELEKENEDKKNNTYVSPIKSDYPYNSKNNFNLNHTLWYLPNVPACYAMYNLLKNHHYFSQYHIELAAGAGPSGLDALPPVLNAIEKNEKTITLSCGKLTTGVSIKEWNAILFLRDTHSPENYFQTAFRAQTPNYKIGIDGKKEILKEKCYIFDFSPNRSLKLLTTYSEKLSESNDEKSSEDKIEEFIKYLPVLITDGNKMINLDAKAVLTFDYLSMDAIGLGKMFGQTKNINVNDEILDIILNENNIEKITKIFDNIKKFKRFNQSKEEEKKSNVDIDELNTSHGNIKDCKTKEYELKKKLENENLSIEEKQKIKIQLTKKEKEEKKEKKKKDDKKNQIKELLRTLLSRIPIFMYLTDATEENLEQVLVKDITNIELFRKTTGITTNEFKELVKIGLIKIDSLDGYIIKFNDLENKNYKYINNLN